MFAIYIHTYQACSHLYLQMQLVLSYLGLCKRNMLTQYLILTFFSCYLLAQDQLWATFEGAAPLTQC